MSDEPDEMGLYEEIQKDLHAQIDSMWARARAGSNIHLECLALAGRLLKVAAPGIDILVGRELLTSKTAAQADVVVAGEEARNNAVISESLFGGKAVKSSAKKGLLGAIKTVEQLAIYSGDPYLSGLCTALKQLRHGQLHHWLVSPKAVAHPKEHASAVMNLKVIPFGVIEYLVASGLYSTKGDAARDVLNRLDIAEDTLNDWRKTELRHNAADYHLQLSCAREFGKHVGDYRLKAMPAFQTWIEYQDQQFGLPAVDRCARMLKKVGAHRGKK